MTGLVGICGAEAGRCNEFWADLQQLWCPDGVEVQCSIGGRLGPAREAQVLYMLERTDAQWICFIDDDHVMPRDWLVRLLARPPVPILGSLYVATSPPFEAQIYGPPNDHLQFAKIALDELPTTGVHPVYAVGASGLLIRREVFAQIPRPWFPLGMWDTYGEDLAFCHKAQQVGIPVHVDVESRLGHLTMMYAWPEVVDGQWITSIKKHWLALPVQAAVRPKNTAMVVR